MYTSPMGSHSLEIILKLLITAIPSTKVHYCVLPHFCKTNFSSSILNPKYTNIKYCLRCQLRMLDHNLRHFGCSFQLSSVKLTLQRLVKKH